MFDHVVSEFTEHPGGHELGPVRHPERVVVVVVDERPHSVLAVGVEGRTPEDVAGITHVVGIGLVARRQRVDQVPEEPHAPVSPGQREDTRVEAALLLGRNLDPEGGKQLVGHVAVDQDGGDLPAIGYHPIGMGRLVDGRREGHEAEPVGARVHPVYRLAPPLGVQVLVHETGSPSVSHSPSEHRAAEAVAGEAGRAQHLGSHDDLGRPEHRGPGVQLRLEQVHDLVDRGHRNAGQPRKLWCTAAG